MEDLLQFLKAGYSIVVLDSGRCAIGKFTDEFADGYFDENIGVIDGCLGDLKMMDSVESLIEFIGDPTQFENK